MQRRPPLMGALAGKQQADHRDGEGHPAQEGEMQAMLWLGKDRVQKMFWEGVRLWELTALALRKRDREQARAGGDRLYGSRASRRGDAVRLHGVGAERVHAVLRHGEAARRRPLQRGGQDQRAAEDRPGRQRRRQGGRCASVHRGEAMKKEHAEEKKRRRLQIKSERCHQNPCHFIKGTQARMHACCTLSYLRHPRPPQSKGTGTRFKPCLWSLGWE
mmetsp:Transcript_16940/g.41376  ORF Transcript_16940/g.41376 Transcript_16940/m.41376 type:complete len:217 (-) Transcript_16940:43-693(-)